MDGKALTDRLATLAEACALLLTFILPLKLGTMSGVPEMPMAYWTDPVAIIISAWPPTLLAPLSGALLALCVAIAPWTGVRSLWLRVFALLWTALAGVSLLGFVNASVWDFPMHAASHTFGVAAYAVSLCLLLERRPQFASWLIGALTSSVALSALSGFYQYFSGFEATRQFAYEQELKSGVQFLKGQFKNRLEQTRVSADFTLCNIYAGYLLMAIPLAVRLVYEFASNVEPPKISRPLLTIPVLGALLFLFIATGSRAALLSAGVAAVVLAAALPFDKRFRYAIFALAPFLLAGFFVMVKLGRGFGSMAYRVDYYIAATKMMLAHPFAGTGWGDFFHEYLRMKLLANDEAPHTPHNFALHFGSQTGVLGFLLVCAILLLPVVAGVAASWRRAKAAGKFSPGLDEAMLFGFCAWAVHSLNDIDFETPGSVCIAIAFASILLCRSFRGPKPETPSPMQGRLGFSLLALTTLVGALFYGRALLVSDIAYANLHTLTDFRFMSKEEIANSDPGKVMNALKTCIEVSPKSPFPWAAGADYLIATGRADDAVPMLREAIARSPERASFHYKIFLIESRDPSTLDDAMKELQAARSLFPKNPEYEKAEADFKLLLERRPAPIPSVFNQRR